MSRMSDLENELKNLMKMTESKDKDTSLGKKISNYLLIVGIISIFLEGLLPFLKYVSIASIAGGYVMSLYREWEVTKKLDPFSVIYCVLITGWVVLRQFVGSKEILYLGQLLTYGYLIRSSHKTLGYWDKGFIAIAVTGTALGGANLYFKSEFLVWGNLIFQIVIILRFLDPILEKIALAHRAKRIAAGEAKRKAKEETMESESEVHAEG
jgi:hypothetical protein